MGNETAPNVSPRQGVLVLAGYGVRVSVERGHLQVEDGVGSNRRCARFSRAERELRRLVVLGHSGTISFDALRWLSDVGASFVQIDSDGRVIAAAGPVGLQDARLRRAQAQASENARGLSIGKELIRKKVERQRALLDRLPGAADARPIVETALARIDGAKTVDRLRVIEAEAALAYWTAWAPVEVRFARRHAARIPAHWKTFVRRGSLLGGKSRRATNPANAILNYLYAIAEAEARLAALAVGCDPGLGIMHVDQKSRDSLACDLMEPVRPIVDAWVLDLLESEAYPFRRSDFFETREGVCRVMPPLTTELAETAPHWSAAVAPVAERFARQLLGLDGPRRRAKETMPTPLTQAHRRAGRDRYRRRPRKKKVSPKVDLPNACAICGVRLTGRAQRHCRSCLAVAHPNRRAEALRANADWDRTATGIPSREIYEREIAPRISALSIDALMRATGLSKSACAQIRRGVRVPNPRHWEALRALVGSRPTSSL